MNAELFGTDGIRGLAGLYPLDKTGAIKIGKAVATYFSKSNDLIVVGRDPRESSPWLSQAVISGMVSTGARVENVGVVPTPGLAYLTRQRGAQAGVMITASHNPFADNGVKIFNRLGRKLTDATQDDLNGLAAGDIADQEGGSASDTPKAVMDYQDFLVATAEGISFEDLRLGLDSANGAASGIASRVFRQLGADVVSLFDQPDGKNINAGCGATDTAALQEVVKAQHLDVGVAFDGDGDRVVLIDDQGRQLSGDHILYILAVTGGHKAVVATQMSNLGLETALGQHGIKLHRTNVGDRYVLEVLEQMGLKLGGEQSGHIILAQYSMTGDGLLAAIVTLRQILRASGKTLADWYDEVSLLPQRLVNIPLADKSLLKRPEVVACMSAAETKLAGRGRLSIRASGTEPKLRIMVEAADADIRAEAIADELKKLLEQSKGRS